jgi:Uma2 family endonuclease
MRRRATYEDLMQVPDHLVAEIIDGELVTSPRPALPHAQATTVIAQDLAPFHRRPGEPGGPGGWWVLFEPELHFDNDVLVPDLAGWRQERMPVVPAAAFVALAPDWICEVVSPRTGRIDRARKMSIYARERVRHLWLADPLARTLEVYRLEDTRWIVVAAYGGDDVVRAEPFDAIELALDRWWLESADPSAGS